jgi:ribosomal protein L11 methylase PrmA
VELTAPSEQESPLAVLLERRHLGGWVDQPRAEGLCWVFYVPQEPGWKERLGALGLAAAEHQGQIRVLGQVRDEDWAENWKEFYHPRRLTKRLVLRPTWAD